VSVEVTSVTPDVPPRVNTENPYMLIEVLGVDGDGLLDVSIESHGFDTEEKYRQLVSIIHGLAEQIRMPVDSPNEN
jgi:hypothetical protein